LRVLLEHAKMTPSGTFGPVVVVEVLEPQVRNQQLMALKQLLTQMVSTPTLSVVPVE
jgi:hypothetical protein